MADVNPFGPDAYKASGSSGSSSKKSDNTDPFSSDAYTDPNTGKSYAAEGQENIGKGASAAGDGIVWASTQLAIGPWKLPITTRGLKDAGVIGAAVVIGILGIVLMSKQDISKLAGKIPPIIPV